MNRRDLLKFFGAGCVASPVIAGVVDNNVRALIIEPPKVEILEATPVEVVNNFDHRMFSMGLGPYEVHVTIIDKHPTNAMLPFTFHADAFVASMKHKMQFFDTTSVENIGGFRQRRFEPAVGEAELLLKFTTPLQVTWHDKR